MAQLQIELKKMNTENQRLREMLSHVNNNYNTLQMHLLTLMQQQQQQQKAKPEHSENHHEVKINYLFVSFPFFCFLHAKNK